MSRAGMPDTQIAIAIQQRGASLKATPGVDHEAEFAGQGAQRGVSGKPRLQRGHDRSDIEPRVQIEIAERARDDVAPALAAILEVEAPSGSSGRILNEIFE